MRLHAFIEARRERILEEWLAFARTCAPAADCLDDKTLRDHASEMLDAIVTDLRTPQAESQRRLKALGKTDAPPTSHEDAHGGTAAQAHGAGRAHGRFSIEQMVSEYRALRASVLRLWLPGLPATHVHEDLMRFNESIDQALAESVASYARVAERGLREEKMQLEARVDQRTQELRAEIREREEAERVRLCLLQRVVKAQEDERRRISREVHDQLGQQVTALGLKLTMLKRSSEVTPYWANEIGRLEKMMRQLDDDVDFVVWQLRPTALDDLGLVEALTDYVSDWAMHFGVSAQFDATGADKQSLSAEVGTVLYRVTQEALNNIAKHARAKHAEVVLRHESDETVLIIEDDGVGFDMQRQKNAGKKSVGLDAMRERAALVGGTVTVEGRPGEGTRVSVRLPSGKRKSGAPGLPNSADRR